MGMLDVAITRRVQEAEDIISVELCRPDGAPLPAFRAGAHIDVEIAPGLIRQYSLCNDPAEEHRYLIGVLRDAASRGGSVALHANFTPGRSVRISEPKNHFALVPARRTLLLAGGIGITPMLAMAEELTRANADFALHYCTRTQGRTAFRARIAAAPFAERATFHFDDGAAAQKLDIDALLASPAADTHLYVCGPGGFIAHVKDAASRHGWAADTVHVEYFGAGGTAVDTATDGTFEVTLASTGKTLSIPAHRSVLAVLLDNGVEIPYSCEEGVCGSCITRVLEGTPDHRDLYFTEEEHALNDQFTPCCSRAKGSRLVLDL